MDQLSHIDALPHLLSFFDVGCALEVERIDRGLSNCSYAVHTARGHYVVKFLGNQPAYTIENDIAIQGQLQEAGIRSPQYLRGRDGGYIYHTPDNLNAVISERLPGIIPHGMSPQLAADIGRHLALFHTSVRGIPRRNEGGLMNPQVSRITSSWARALFDRPVPRGIIHGDFHCGNLLVDPAHADRVTAVLDFEEAGENLYIVDLAVTLIGISTARSWEVQPEPPFMEAVRQGYEAVRPLSAEESLWLPRAIRYVSEAWIRWFEAHGFDEYARQHRQRYRHYLQSMERTCNRTLMSRTAPSSRD